MKTNPFNQLIIEFFKEDLPAFKVISQYSNGPYWNISFSDHDLITIELGGDIGFSVEVIIDKIKYSLWQYDRSVISKMKTTKENILYQLNVLKMLLNDIK